jgi:hypothetical protein
MYGVTNPENYDALVGRGAPDSYLVAMNDYNVMFTNRR